jgi:hypothetical protein
MPSETSVIQIASRKLINTAVGPIRGVPSCSHNGSAVAYCGIVTAFTGAPTHSLGFRIGDAIEALVPVSAHRYLYDIHSADSFQSKGVNVFRSRYLAKHKEVSYYERLAHPWLTL